tara:strand:- start:60 stop:287 length:228 start_codon:yes stop_codon:yes gene_type:complete
MGGAGRMVVDPRVAAQEEAEKTFEKFIVWCKRGTLYAIALLLAVASCNFGVEDGPTKTGSQYNGEQYNPSNLNKK